MHHYRVLPAVSGTTRTWYEGDALGDMRQMLLYYERALFFTEVTLASQKRELPQ